MGKVVKAVVGVGLLVAGALTGGATSLLGLGILTKGTMLAVGASLVLGAASEAFLTPSVPESQLSRLNIRLDASAPRKAALGTTAFPLDLRYHEATGTDQEYIHYIIAHAAHAVQSIDEIWFEQDLAWSASGGVTSKYSGYLTVTTRTEGAAGNEISISSTWGSGERLTGCAYTYIRIKRTGNSKKSESPLVSGLPSRVTVIGEGAALYDPRLDSTVTGGSGAHRADDQSTWGASYSPADSYDNPALQLLWWLLGWEINGKLSIGCGVPPARIDMESFIEAANICDESVTLASGGSQERYRTSGTASDGDDRMDIINTFLACMNGTLRDNGGRLALEILKNDLADYVLDFDDDDILDEFDWQQTKSLAQSYNVARGRYVDPSDNSLYQLVDYPEVGITSPDGIERVMSLDLPYVEDGRRAQRIAKQVLQRNQYRGTFAATFTAKALGCDVGEIVRVTFAPLAFSNKLFRIIDKEISADGRVPLVMVEENAAIYAWDDEDTAPVTPAAPTVYDPLNSPFILADGENEDAAAAAQADATQALADAATAISDAATAQATADGKVTTFYQSSAPTADGVGDLWIDTDTDRLYRWSGSSWLEIQDADIATAISDAATAQTTADGKIVSFFQASAPTAEGVGDLWTDTDDDNHLYRWSGSAWVSVRDAGIVAALADAAAAQSTADNKIETFYQDAEPGSASEGDIWFDTDDGNRQYRYTSSSWTEVQDGQIGTAISNAATAQATADGKVTTYLDDNEPYPVDLQVDATTTTSISLSMDFTAAFAQGDLWLDEAEGALHRWNANTASWSDVLADLTSTAQITFSDPPPFNIQADSLGETTTDLSNVQSSIEVFRGGVKQTSGVTVGTITASPSSGITASASVSSGVVTVTLSQADAAGTVSVPITIGGIIYARKVTVNRTLAPPNTGGDMGSTGFVDTNWVNISTSTMATVTDSGARVESDGSGEIRFSGSASYNGSSAVVIRAQYSIDAVTWTDVGASDDTGSAPITVPGEEEPGFVALTATTVTGLTINTNYYVRLRARRLSGSGVISFSAPTFSAQQP